MPKARKLAVIYRPITELKPYAGNARTHDDEQVRQIVASIRAFGFTAPILVDEAGEIIAGHGRLAAALKLRLTEVPTIALKDLSEAEKRAYRIADNKLTLNGDWDMKALTEELQALDTGEIDLELTGFSLEELEDLATWTPSEDPKASRGKLDCVCPTCSRKHKSKPEETTETP